MAQWSGFVALGTYSAGTFTELSGVNGYARQAWAFNGPSAGWVEGAGSPVDFGLVAGPDWVFNAYGFFSGATGGSPALVYALPRSRDVAPGLHCRVVPADVVYSETDRVTQGGQSVDAGQILTLAAAAGWGAGAGGSLLTSGGTVTGAVLFNSGGPLNVEINQAETASATVAYLGINVNYDPSAFGNSQRMILNSTTLTPSITNTTICESGFNSFVYLNGPGTQTGEVNCGHSYLQVNAGAHFHTGEMYETSFLNNGTIDSLSSFLCGTNNGNSGTLGSYNGVKVQLQNTNTVAGSVGTFAGLDMEALSGGGSVPTSYYVIRNSESNASIATVGNVVIGSLTPPGSSNLLQIKTSSAAGSVFPLFVNSGVAGGNAFYVTAAGTGYLFGTFTVGSVQVGSGGPAWSAGTGAPTFTAPKGSLYSRTDGGVGTTLYVSQGSGTWNAVAGV